MSNIDFSLLPDFIVEAEEHLQEMEALLLQLVQTPGDLELLNDIFRPIHTIKGGAQYIGLEKISRLAHRLEDLLDLLREGAMASSGAIVETLIAATDRIALLVRELEQDRRENSDVDDLVTRISHWLDTGSTAAAPLEPHAHTAPDQALQGEFDSDEDDAELSAIFLDHLRDHYRELAALAAQLPTAPRKEGVLRACGEVLSQMHASANYMDYMALVQRYRQWQDEIERLLRDGAELDAGQLAFMQHNMDELATLFPALRALQPPAVVAKNAEPQEGGGDITDAVMQAFAAFADDAAAAPAPHQPAAAQQGSNCDIDLALLPDFIIETTEHLDEMEALLLQLLLQPDDREVLNDIFRPVHSIKGGAQYLGLKRVSRLAHVLEDLLDLLREGALPSSIDIIETLIAARDRLVTLTRELESTQCEHSAVEDVIAQIEAWLPGHAPQPESAAPASDAGQDGSGTGSAPAVTDEEDDKELYGIFITHLQEQVEALEGLLAASTSGNGQGVLLQQARTLVEAMRSSANYMDYLQLVQRHNRVLEQIAEAERQLQDGDTVSLQFLADYRDALQQLFPQLGTAASSAPATPTPTPVRVIVNEPVVGGLEDTLAKKDSAARAEAVARPSATEAMLYQSLSGALEQSLTQRDSTQDETLHQIFDELVSTSRGTARQSAVAQPAASVPVTKAARAVGGAKKEGTESRMRKSVRVDADKIDTLMNQVGELVVDRSYFFQLLGEMRGLQRHLKDTLGLEQKEVKMLRAFTYRLGEAISSLGRTSNELQEGVMKMRMLPISQIFNRYPRLVHDLTRNSDKRVNLVVKGEDTELDRMIVEELSDPLIHIIRNSVDHGLETLQERTLLGKNGEGTLVLEAYQESNHIVIEVTDDGKGIDPARVRSKAIEKGLFTAEELARFSNDDIIALIMTPGFSTADRITGTSGRGVGMDVVKKNIEKLNGTLEIDSKIGVGTQMRLRIPLTLAIIHALMVRVAGDLFTIPLANVDETVRIFQSDTSTVEGVEVIHLRGETLPIFRLSNLFGVQTPSPTDKSFVVIVSVGGARTGFVVDELLGQEEVVIKPLADYVQDKSGFSGATIIGDGRISLILDVYELVRMTTTKQAKRQVQQATELKSKIRRRGMSGSALASETLPE